MTTDPWREKAACAGHPCAHWFDAGMPNERADARARRHAKAVAVCRRCEARQDCLADALAHGDVGVRGGVVLTGPPIDHGTEKGYRQHLERVVPPCEACLAAWARRSARLRGRRAG